MNRARFLLVLLSALLLLAAAPAAAFTPDANMERSEIPDLYKWDLSKILPNDEAFDPALERANAMRGKLSSYQGRLADAQTLRECLELYFDVRLATNKLTLYSNLRLETNQVSPELRGMSDRALQAMNELMAAAAFIRREILTLDDRALADAYRREPALSAYRPYIDEIRRRKDRVLGAEAERILALAGDNLWAEIDLNEIPSDHEKTFFAIMSDLPLPTVMSEEGEPVQLAFSNYPRFRRSPNREVRREAVEGFFGALHDFRHVFASAFAGQVNFTTFLARSRGYDSALEAYLAMDDIDPAVYRNLISAIRDNLEPLHRYVELRKRALGIDDLRIYDLYVPMVPSEEMDFTFEEARKVLPEALAPLGKEYGKVLEHGLDPAGGWIDLYPHKDKDSGAFSASVYGVEPFVKMNWFGGYDDLSTLAHEYGHALHTHLSHANQPYITADYASFIAEIASTCNEMLLADHLMKNAEDESTRLFLLNELLESIRTTIYRQALFAEFELAAHEAAERGVTLTPEFLDSTYSSLIRDYYGPGFTLGEHDGVEWAYVGHFYYKFYMYTYATGLSSGIAFAEMVKNDGGEAVERYLEMLRSGSSAPPLTLLKRAGLDWTKPDAIVAAAELMDETITEMEKILGGN